MAKLIVGCGYLGLRVARHWLAEGERVSAVTRSSLRAKELAAEGLDPIVADVTQAGSLAFLPQVDCALYAVGYDRSAAPPMREVYVAGLRNVLDSLSSQLAKLIYVSSTGVYGQQEGDAVDESSPCRPRREGGKICLEAEGVLRQHALGANCIVLRMAGIYGPDRVPRQRDLLAGQPLPLPTEGILNLIHVDDAAEIVVELARTVAPPELFCVSDGHSADRLRFYHYLAELLQAPVPQFIEPHAAEHVSQRASSNKRVDSSKLHAQLGRALRYPSYREGLAAIINSAQ